jgi:hypothetical protein
MNAGEVFGQIISAGSDAFVKREERKTAEASSREAIAVSNQNQSMAQQVANSLSDNKDKYILGAVVVVIGIFVITSLNK